MDEVAEAEKPLEWHMWPPRATSEANRRVVVVSHFTPDSGRLAYDTDYAIMHSELTEGFYGIYGIVRSVSKHAGELPRPITNYWVEDASAYKEQIVINWTSRDFEVQM